MPNWGRAELFSTADQGRVGGIVGSFSKFDSVAEKGKLSQCCIAQSCDGNKAKSHMTTRLGLQVLLHTEFVHSWMDDAIVDNSSHFSYSC